jgi:hypothetical protein
MHEKVDDVERALRLRFPSIKRVIGHAEPTPVMGGGRSSNHRAL